MGKLSNSGYDYAPLWTLGEDVPGKLYCQISSTPAAQTVNYFLNRIGNGSQPDFPNQFKAGYESHKLFQCYEIAGALDTETMSGKVSGTIGDGVYITL